MRPLSDLRRSFVFAGGPSSDLRTFSANRPSSDLHSLWSLSSHFVPFRRRPYMKPSWNLHEIFRKPPGNRRNLHGTFTELSGLCVVLVLHQTLIRPSWVSDFRRRPSSALQGFSRFTNRPSSSLHGFSLFRARRSAGRSFSSESYDPASSSEVCNVSRDNISKEGKTEIRRVQPNLPALTPQKICEILDNTKCTQNAHEAKT